MTSNQPLRVTIFILPSEYVSHNISLYHMKNVNLAQSINELDEKKKMKETHSHKIIIA